MTQAIANIDQESLALPESVELLPANKRFTNRFNLVSESSGNKYLIAQCRYNPENGKGGWWACSCPSYKFGRKGAKMCKHLRDLGLPGNHQPFFIGELSVGALDGGVGAQTLRDNDRHAAAKAPLRALEGGQGKRRKAMPKASKPAAEVEAAAAPKALPQGRLVPTNVSMDGGKIVVEFDAADSAAVFALLAQLSK